MILVCRKANGFYLVKLQLIPVTKEWVVHLLNSFWPSSLCVHRGVCLCVCVILLWVNCNTLLVPSFTNQLNISFVYFIFVVRVITQSFSPKNLLVVLEVIHLDVQWIPVTEQGKLCCQGRVPLFWRKPGQLFSKFQEEIPGAIAL